MSMQSVLAHLPGFLTGSAGRAIRPIEHVAASAAAHRPALEGLAEGTLTAQRADDLFLGVADELSVDSAWNGVKAARPALDDALGRERGTKVAQSIHDGLSNLRTPIIKGKIADRYADEAKLVSDGSRDHAAYVARVDADAWAEVGGQSPRLLQEAMLEEVLPQLELVAARTATTRLIVGSAGIGAATAGIVALRRRDDAPVSPVTPSIDTPSIDTPTFDTPTFAAFPAPPPTWG